MLISASMLSFLYAFITKSQILSHVTRRVVDGIGKAPEKSANMPIVVVIEQLPPLPGPTMIDIDPTDWLIIPPPNRFMVYADNLCDTCVLGVFIEGIGTDPPAVSWIQIDWDRPVSMDLPANALGAFFAVLDYATDSISIRQIDWFGAVDGYEILALRNELQNAYRGMGPVLE